MSNTYIEDMRRAVDAHLRDFDTNYGDPALLDLYTLLALTRGDQVTSADVHDAWAVWRPRTAPHHPSIVLFEELTPDVQDMDHGYVEAIRKAVRSLA